MLPIICKYAKTLNIWKFYLVNLGLNSSNFGNELEYDFKDPGIMSNSLYFIGHIKSTTYWLSYWQSLISSDVPKRIHFTSESRSSFLNKAFELFYISFIPFLFCSSFQFRTIVCEVSSPNWEYYLDFIEVLKTT